MQNTTIVKHLNFGDDAKEKVFKGIEKLTQAVSSTLGASGKCVILEDQTGNPVITKDGVTVADSITLLDPVENMGATLLKEAARKTVREAGDGTTTATVLAYAILKESYKLLNKQTTRNLKDGINEAVEKVIKYLDTLSKPVSGKKIDHVATISSNNDIELGKIIGDAFREVDETGIVMMETHELPETTIEKIEGTQYEMGLKSNHFVTNQEKGVAELDNPLVLIVESKIENIRKIQRILEYIIDRDSDAYGRSLLIIGDADPQVVSALAMNKVKGNLKVNVIDAPIFGVAKQDTLNDLALLTGAIVINEDLGDDMDMIQPIHLGTCLKAATDTTNTIIQVEEKSEEVLELITNLQAKIKKATHPNMVIKLEKRLSRLLAKVAIVKVGANSEVELKEKRDRVEDAICATKAAIKEGIVPGGGIALLNAAAKLNLDNIGESVLAKAIQAPFETILENAGIEIISSNMEEGKGLDVVTGKTVNMVKSGIVDPLLVTKSALRNAASVATTILSTDCVINNIRVNESNR
jgi:chaperonin GroEL